MQYPMADAFNGASERADHADFPQLRMLTLKTVQAASDAQDVPSLAPYVWAPSSESTISARSTDGSFGTPYVMLFVHVINQLLLDGCLSSRSRHLFHPHTDVLLPHSARNLLKLILTGWTGLDRPCRYPSAACFYAVRELLRNPPSSGGQQGAPTADSQNAFPIGIITAAVGGTPIEKWMAAPAILDGTPASLGGNGSCGGTVMRRKSDVIVDPAPPPGNASCNPNTPGVSTLYHGMIAPLLPMRLSAVLWYQVRTGSMYVLLPAAAAGNQPPPFVWSGWVRCLLAVCVHERGMRRPPTGQVVGKASRVDQKMDGWLDGRSTSVFVRHDHQIVN